MMRLTLLLIAMIVPIAAASADDGYHSTYGNAWSTQGSHGGHFGSHYSSYFWPYYPAIPAKYEVEAAKARLSYSKYSPYSAWWQVQATKERLSALRYANDYYYGFYDVPVFRGRVWDDRSDRDRSYGEDHWRKNDEHRERTWTDDSPEDVHVPIAEEIKMELEKDGVIRVSE